MFVEVGAARPDYLSMSALFRSAGWKVILVEPNLEFCALHRAAGHEVLQYARADYDADDVSSVVDSRGEAYRDGHVSFESFSAISVKDSNRFVPISRSGRFLSTCGSSSPNDVYVRAEEFSPALRFVLRTFTGAMTFARRIRAAVLRTAGAARKRRP